MIPELYILDDDEQYAELLTEVANNAGWKASHEQSPYQFFNKTIEPHAVLVLDLNMPEMDGIEVIRKLADKNLHLLLILISGFDTRVLHSAQQLAKAHDFKVIATLAKPVPIHEFIEVLEQTSTNIRHEKKAPAIKQNISPEELQHGLNEHQFILHYQPQVNMKTSKFEGVESLVRWQHPERGLVYPDQFIQLAEQNDLIDQLTEEVITLAVEQNKEWQTENFSIPISVNVSAQNITSLSLPEQLKELTDKHTVTPENITLEITESAVMKQLTSSLDVLNRLRMKGFSLSIDDFGTGYSSLTHLYQAPFTELKIDQNFVDHMTNDAEALVIVKICIMLGQMLGMRLVAEGVETQEIWHELKSLGCDIAQGYFIAKPMSADELLIWAKTH